MTTFNLFYRGCDISFGVYRVYIFTSVVSPVWLADRSEIDITHQVIENYFSCHAHNFVSVVVVVVVVVVDDDVVVFVVVVGADCMSREGELVPGEDLPPEL